MSFALLNKSLQAAFSVCGRSDVFFSAEVQNVFFLGLEGITGGTVLLNEEMMLTTREKTRL